MKSKGKGVKVGRALDEQCRIGETLNALLPEAFLLPEALLSFAEWEIGSYVHQEKPMWNPF